MVVQRLFCSEGGGGWTFGFSKVGTMAPRMGPSHGVPFAMPCIL